MKRRGREGNQEGDGGGMSRDVGRKRGGGGWVTSRETGLGRDKKTTEREPSREVKRGGSYCLGILTDEEEVMLHCDSDEVNRRRAPSNGTHAKATSSPSCPLLSRELTADKREKPITAKHFFLFFKSIRMIISSLGCCYEALLLKIQFQMKM